MQRRSIRLWATQHSNAFERMKNIITLAILGATALAAPAAGYIDLVNRSPGTVVVPIYGPNPTDSSVFQQGNATTNGGAIDWTGYPGLRGDGYTAELLAGPLGTAAEGLVG